MPFASEGAFYASFGADAVRGEYVNDAANDLSNAYLLQRYFIHANLHFGPHVRVFLQSGSSLEGWRTGGPRPINRDELNIHQAFLDLAAGPLTLRLGRQELLFGAQRLVGPRDLFNVRLAFDAARLVYAEGRTRIDVFAARPVLPKPGIFDDGPDTSQAFWGVYGTALRGRARTFDAYVLGIDRSSVNAARRQTREATGLRFWGKTGSLDYNTEVMAATGRYSVATISE